MAPLVLSLLFCVDGVMASAKMEVPLGQLVVLEAEALEAGYDYKWVVNKDKDIITTQSGTVFSYTFDVQGEYKVNLALSNDLGNVKNTTISIMVGGRYSKPAGGSGVGNFDNESKVIVTTLPPMDQNNTVHILGEEGIVLFDIEPRVDVLEHRIDKNIAVDSEGDGIPNNDVDNSAESSFLTGGIWRTEYKSSDASEATAEVTLVTSTGKKITQEVKIVFDEFLQTEEEIKAVLDSLPPINSTDRKIYVYDEKDTVAFYARRSQGTILEYRIDTNIFVDSDGDGNASNDIDNRSDSSFKTGDVWTTEYAKTGQQIISQLIVVGQGGVASRIQREVVFIDRPVTQDPETGEAAEGIQLLADKEFVQKGDPIEFRVEGLTYGHENYTFEWDFDGDGTYDQTIEGEAKASYIYDEPGTPVVTVHIFDKEANEGTFTREIQVKDIAVTAANFDFTMDGLKVTFNNTSTASAALENKALTHTWSFGDTDEENFEKQKGQINTVSPTYTYAKPGTYVVTLNIADADGATNSKSMEVVLAGDTAETPAEEVSENGEKSGLVGKIFKVILYIFLVIVLLVLLMVGGLLIFLKVQNPDLIFEELIDELKIKILSMLGMSDVLDDTAHASDAHSPGVTGGVIPPYRPQRSSAPDLKVSKADTMSSGKSAATVNVNIDLSKPDAPVPEWMKTPSTPAKEVPKKESVIEAEVIEMPKSVPKPVVQSELKTPTPTTPPAPAPKPELKPESKPQTPSSAPKPQPTSQMSNPTSNNQAPKQSVPQNKKPNSGPTQPAPQQTSTPTPAVQPIPKSQAGPSPTPAAVPRPQIPEQQNPPTQVPKPQASPEAPTLAPPVQAPRPTTPPITTVPTQAPRPLTPENKPASPTPSGETNKPIQPNSSPQSPQSFNPPKDLSKPDGPIPDWLKDA